MRFGLVATFALSTVLASLAACGSGSDDTGNPDDGTSSGSGSGSGGGKDSGGGTILTGDDGGGSSSGGDDGGTGPSDASSNTSPDSHLSDGGWATAAHPDLPQITNAGGGP